METEKRITRLPDGVVQGAVTVDGRQVCGVKTGSWIDEQGVRKSDQVSICHYPRMIQRSLEDFTSQDFNPDTLRIKKNP